MCMLIKFSIQTTHLNLQINRRRNAKSKVNLLLQEGCSHPYFQKNPPLPTDRWTISMSSFDPDSFHLLGEGTFSSVYFSTIQGPLSTPTNLAHYKNCVQHPLAVKICKGMYILPIESGGFVCCMNTGHS